MTPFRELRRSAPNAPSAFRVVSVPVLSMFAWCGAVTPFSIVFALGLVSDVLDGALARRLGQETTFGALLDQWGDFARWISLPLVAWWLWPEVIAREARCVILALACILLLTSIAYLEYRAVPGYHTWSVELGAVLMGISVPLSLFFEIAWPFRVAALFQLVCASDELASRCWPQSVGTTCRRSSTLRGSAAPRSTLDRTVRASPRGRHGIRAERALHRVLRIFSA